MDEAKTFSVCQGCGAWKETGSGLMSFLGDYDMTFFIEQHMARCPMTGKPEIIKAVREDDLDFQPLPHEKKWRPEDCPGYRPPQEPTFTRYTTDVRERLVGVWCTRNFGGHSDETLLLRSDGSGAVDFYNVAFCGRQEIGWRLETMRICVDGGDSYFRSKRFHFEVGRFVNFRGDETDMLRAYDRGTENEPLEFFRSAQSIESYTIPDA